jgi:RNA polymerase-binding protein DksA
MSEKKPAKMSDADLKFFEEMLIEKRRQLVTAQSDSERANAFQGQKNQAGDGSDSDSADSATDYNSLETNFSLAAREGKYLVYLEEALKRIKNGTFGVCKVCNQLIPKARLMAVPTATKCVNCKEETKKKEILDNRMEMAKMFAEAQRKEMLRKAADR